MKCLKAVGIKLLFFGGGTVVIQPGNTFERYTKTERLKIAAALKHAPSKASISFTVTLEYRFAQNTNCGFCPASMERTAFKCIQILQTHCLSLLHILCKRLLIFSPGYLCGQLSDTTQLLHLTQLLLWLLVPNRISALKERHCTANEKMLVSNGSSLLKDANVFDNDDSISGQTNMFSPFLYISSFLFSRKMMDSGQLDFYQHSTLCTNTCRSTKFDLLINNTRFPPDGTGLTTPTSSQGKNQNIVYYCVLQYKAP